MKLLEDYFEETREPQSNFLSFCEDTNHTISLHSSLTKQILT